MYRIDEDELKPPGWFTRKWIWFWYNDVTRFAVLLGVPVLPILAVLAYCGVEGEARRTWCLMTYFSFTCWMMLDNDYSQLRRIGLDETRKPLKIKN